MLPAAELAQMQVEVERTLVDTCAIVRVEVTGQDDYGYPVKDETRTEVACRISPETSNRGEQIIAERMQLVAPFLITLPADTDVRPSDQIESDGRTFNVASGVGGRTWEIVKRVLVDEVT